MTVDPKWPVKFSQSKWAEFTEGLEGGSVVDHMFMVQDAQVATGYGITWTGKSLAVQGKIDAKRLSWSYKKGHSKEFLPCSATDIDKDYDAALDADPGLYTTNGHLPEWRDKMQCRTTKDSLLKELYRRVVSNANTIRTAKLISNFDDIPADAQLCIISMTWGFGPNWGESLQKSRPQLFNKLLNFRKACEKSDFNEAAKFAVYESKENSIQRRGRFQGEMLRNAQFVANGRGSLDECYWPGLPPMVEAVGIDSAIEGPPPLFGPRRLGPTGGADRF